MTAASTRPGDTIRRVTRDWLGFKPTPDHLAQLEDAVFAAVDALEADVARLITENHEAWAKVNALQAALDWIEGDSSEGYRLVGEAIAAVEEALSRV